MAEKKPAPKRVCQVCGQSVEAKTTDEHAYVAAFMRWARRKAEAGTPGLTMKPGWEQE